MAKFTYLLPAPDQLECATSEGTDSKFVTGCFRLAANAACICDESRGECKSCGSSMMQRDDSSHDTSIVICRTRISSSQIIV